MNKFNQQIIVKGCIAGKRKWQKRLFDEFSQPMFAVCLSYAPDHDAANDLLQEGFLKVFENIHKFSNSGSLEGWIRRVIVNNCIDTYRGDKWYRNRNDELSEADIINSSESDHTLNLANSQLDQEDFLKITRSLPAGYRVILNLYFLEDLTHKEIASKLDISEGTSKSQLSKAKRYLKDRLIKMIDAG